MPDPAIPFANHQCPLCGQPNRCAPAEAGSFTSDCWCRSHTFSSELLALIDPEQRDKSCICQACATHIPTQNAREP